MNINFRQGLISYQQSGPQALFLLPGSLSQYVTLNVSPQPLIATIAHGSSDYLLKFDTTVQNAFGPLPGNMTSWLFIDQNLINGELTFGSTTLEPITSLVTPLNPVNGQLWFDLNESVMKTFTGVKWIVTPRLVVGKVMSGSTNQIVMYTVGSSVGLSVPSEPGYLLLDSQLRPLRTSAGELLTNGTAVRVKTTVGTSGVLSEPVNSFVPVRANQAIPAMSLVYFSGTDAVSIASSNPASPQIPIGIVQQPLALNEVGVVTQNGEIVYDQWSFTSDQVGQPLYGDFNGRLTTVRPQGTQVYRVGFVKNANTILFDIDTEVQLTITTGAAPIFVAAPPLTAATSQNGNGENVTLITLPASTGSLDGYMSAAQAAQLGSFETRIEQNTLDITTLQTSKANTVHTHAIADVIGLQTNLTALQTQVDAKIPHVSGTTGNFTSIAGDGTLLDSGYSYGSFALMNHVHLISDVTGLQNALDLKSPIVHNHTEAEVIGLQASLDEKAFVNHTHTISDVTGLQTALDAKEPAIPFGTIGQYWRGDKTWQDMPAGGSGPTALNELTDVALSYIQGGQVLRYNGSQWTNQYFETINELQELFDVQLSDPVTGAALLYNTSNARWQNHVITLAQYVGDVQLASPQAGQFLAYNGTKWVNVNAPSGGSGGGATALNQLTDVAVTYEQYGQVLTWNGNAWTNMDVPSSGGATLLTQLGDVALEYIEDYQYLRYYNGVWSNASLDQVKPAPLQVHTDTTLAYDFGSAAQHNTVFRSTANTDVQILVHADETFTGADTFDMNNYNPQNPGPMPIGGSALFGKHGSGNVTFVPDSGVTINSPYSLMMNVLHAKATLIKVGPNEWDLEGHLAA